MWFVSRDRKGFTLPELLVVIAIIGTLAMVGIPAFKRMIQRAHQAEAKANLGELFVAEAALYSEFGVYGNNLLAMGYEVDGSPVEMSYRFGFSSDPVTWTCTAASIAPPLASASGPSIDLSMPKYYNVAPTPDYCNSFGRVSLSLMDDAINAAVGPEPYRTYTAVATGVITMGVNRDNPAGGVNDLDTWTMDETRMLRNTRYGIR
jgi:prepilin-type N-terminal cleavage/methylation domain-containing protein